MGLKTDVNVHFIAEAACFTPHRNREVIRESVSVIAVCLAGD